MTITHIGLFKDLTLPDPGSLRFSDIDAEKQAAVDYVTRRYLETLWLPDVSLDETFWS